MKNWRLIKIIEDCGAKQMAIDEAMLVARSKGLVPNTLRFFTWKPSAITLGFFQNLDQEINIDKAKAMNVDIVRRYSGGGAVFHQDELTYSLVVSEKDVQKNIFDSYKYLCQGVISGLDYLGLKAEFKPVNDILLDGKKISGNAQTRKHGVILQHGTILLSLDVERMFSLLKVPDEKMKGKAIANVKERVTSLKNEFPNKKFNLNKLEEIFSLGFSKTLGINLNKGNLIAEENKLIQELYLNKYLSKDWNYKQVYKPL